MKAINIGAPYLNEYLTERFENQKFTDIWSSDDAFLEDINSSKIDLSFLDDTQKELIYYLLYASYGNSTIANFTTLQFKYKVFTIIYQYAPAWLKRREIQMALFKLDITSEDFFKGTKVIYNSSENPSSAPSTDTLEELTTIDHQNTTNYKYNKLDAYSRLYNIVYNDGTKDFINQFKKLFINVVVSDITILTED